MKRREFITLLGGAVAWPLAARGQQPAIPVIGVLYGVSAAERADHMEAFRRGLGETGFVEGRNVAIEYRWANGQLDRMPWMVADLIGRRVAVILMGGNLTGVTFFAAQLLQKQVGIVHDLVPKATTIGLLVNPNNPRHQADIGDVQAAGETLGLKVEVAKAGSERDLDAAFVRLVQRNARALILAGDAFFLFEREQIAALAARHAIPAMYNSRDFVAAGGLISYGASLTDAAHQAGIYAARIVKGEKPSNLPVMQPTKFELVINLKTAKALGLTVPDKRRAELAVPLIWF